MGDHGARGDTGARPRRLPNVKVVQLLGGVGAPHATIDGPEQVRRAGEIFGAQHYYLNAPMRVDSAERRAGAAGRSLGPRGAGTGTAVGPGARRASAPSCPVFSTQYHSGYISYDELRRLDRHGRGRRDLLVLL